MKKRNFSAEFKRESAQLVVDQNYTVADAAKAMDVGLSTMTRWVKQLRDERQGKTPKASPITPEQIEIRELRKKLQRIEMENEILKKATVDSIGQRNSYVCVFRSIRSRIGIEVRSAIRIHSINRELNFFYRFLTRFFAAFHYRGIFPQ